MVLKVNLATRANLANPVRSGQGVQLEFKVLLALMANKVSKGLKVFKENEATPELKDLPDRLVSLVKLDHKV